MELVRDEVTEYLDTRYLTAPEAAWRLFQFPMHAKSHAIERLPVHLENRETIYFSEGRETDAAANSACKKTKLTAWFQLNAAEASSGAADSGIAPAAQQWRYTDIPDHYVWDGSTTSWKRRQRRAKGGRILARMYAVSPKDLERFALRLMLLHVPGACGFQHLRTVEGIIYGTFREAAQARGLIQSDKEIELTLEEFILSECSPIKLCDFFALLLIWHEVGDARPIWDAYWEDFARLFMQPLPHGRALPAPFAHNQALQLVDGCLRRFSMRASDFLLIPMLGANGESLELVGVLQNNGWGPIANSPVFCRKVAEFL